MRIAMVLGLLIGVAVEGGRLFGGGALPHPTARPAVPLPSTEAPLLRRIPLLNPDVLAVDEQTGRVFVGGGEGVGAGHVYMLDAQSGTVLRTVAVGTLPRAIVVDVLTNRVFVTLTSGQDGYVSTLDARSGSVLRTVQVGGTIAAPALNERAERVYVLVASPIDARTGRVTGHAVLAVLDTTGALRRKVTLPDYAGDAGGKPYGVAVDVRTSRVFVLTDSFVDVYGAARL